MIGWMKNLSYAERNARKLYRTLESSIAGQIYRKDDREDLAGEVVLRGLEKENLGFGYLKTSIANAAIDEMRRKSPFGKNGARRARGCRLSDEMDVMDQGEDLAYVEAHAVIESIPHPVYRKIALGLFEGKETSEIAEDLDATIPSVRSMIYRMRKYCRQNTIA